MMFRQPQTILGQVISILIGTLVLSFSLSFVVLVNYGPFIPPPMGPIENAFAIAVVVRALQATPAADRVNAAREMSTSEFRILLGPAACQHDADEDHLVRSVITRALAGYPGRITLKRCAHATDVEVALPSGPISIQFDDQNGPSVAFVGIPVVVALLFLLLAVTALSMWAAWRITRPLRELAGNVDAFGQNIVVAPLPSNGPREIRLVARALNRMQESVASFVQDRTRLLAAIGHDLRTPLTRLRLGVQLDLSSGSRATMLRDIDQLQSMIDSALAFLKGQSGAEDREWTDIGALVATVCDEFEELGSVVDFERETYLPCICQPVAIRRALANLVDNACRFGTHVAVRAYALDGSAILQVEDDGPGIPDAEKLRVLQPFARVNDSRPSEKGHIGLGLAIVVDVTRANSGTFILRDADPTGLIAQIQLPIDGRGRLTGI